MKTRWPWALAGQFAASAVLSALAALIPVVFSRAAGALGVVMSVVLIVWGAVSSFVVTRIGVNNYAAWIAPPVMMAVMPWIIVGYPPDAGMTLICALVSLIGAATGDVVKRRAKE